MERTLQQYPIEEEHPCKCDDRHATRVDDKYEWIKRTYYEYTRYYQCMKCNCQWYIRQYLVAKDASVVITQEPQEIDE